MTAASTPMPLSTDALRWRCDPATFKFKTTNDLEPTGQLIGQETAIDALEFGLEIDAPGQNIFVRGLVGTGRSTLVQRLVAQVKPACALSLDRAYVYNFRRPDRPRLVTLGRGQGEQFRRQVDTFIEMIKTDLAAAMRSDLVKTRGAEIEAKFNENFRETTKPFEAELRKAGYAMLSIQAGPASRQMIVPLVDGEAATPEAIQTMKSEGKVTDEQVEAWDKDITEWNKRVQEVGEKVQELRDARDEQVKNLVHTELRALLEQGVRGIRTSYPQPEVQTFLDEVIDDLITKRLGDLGEKDDFVERYRVNVVLSQGGDDEACPTIFEYAPTAQALLGQIDVAFDPDDDGVFAPHMMVRGGSILQADGGFLILDANDLVSEPGAYRALMRTLRSGVIEWGTPPGTHQQPRAFVKPQSIPIKVKVILIGDPSIYYMLDSADSDFRAQFKVLADFDSVIDRDANGLRYYSDVIASIARSDMLLPFTREAVAALTEHGARIASQADKLTSRFGRLADLQREAAFIARKEGGDVVTAEHVFEAVRRTKRRANLPSRRFQGMINKGVIKVQTTGQTVGQVNALAVIQAGQLMYGFPNRITATIAPGRTGAINIEQEALMSGQIHTKGFLTLSGALRTLLRPRHPLVFSASITFEQSYGGVDGDSASGIELCCLLSAMTEIPVNQSLAMTGAIDQLGNILPIGGANEKIEGFYDACEHNGLTGDQGVIIPLANAGDLMLRHDVVDACALGKFAVYAVGHVREAVALLLGTDPDKVIQEASARAQALWLASAEPPSMPRA